MYINILLRPLCWWVSLALRLKLRFSEVGRAEMEKTILVSIFLCIYGRLQIMQNDYYTRIEVRWVNHVLSHKVLLTNYIQKATDLKK